MKTINYGPFLGMNNRLPDSGLRVSLPQLNGQYLRDAVNVDINNKRNIVRRRGKRLAQAVTIPHSLFKGSAKTYLVRDSVLYSVTLPTYTETLLKVLTNNDPMSYVENNGVVYASNGTDSLRLEGNTVYSIGMVAPTQPTISATTGSLPPGTYLVALSYSNNVSGEEDALCKPVAHTLAATGGLIVTLPTDVVGTHLNVYMTQPNGQTGYLQTAVVVGTASVTRTVVVTGREWQQRYEDVLPAGKLFTSNGRLCSFNGKRVYVGLPYRYGYYLPTEGYIDFPENVTVAIENQGGTYIAADNTYWIPGDLGDVQGGLDTVLPYGAVSGTEFSFPDKSVVGWFGAKGVVIGAQDGQVSAVMAEHIDQTPPASGVSAVFESNGYRRVVACGWCVNIENQAISRYDDWGFTSCSGGYATQADGVYELDTSDPTSWCVDFGKSSFEADNMKHVPTVYVGVSSSDLLTLDVLTPGGDTYSYEARASDEDLKTQRFDLGKGLRANWYNFILRNDKGCDFELVSMTLLPAISKRRI